MASHLDYQTTKLKRSILELSTIVEENAQKALLAFQRRDSEIAMEVVKKDKLIDSIEIDLEEDCLKLIALYQPVAIDLRMLVSMLKINDALERIGDLSKDISKKVILLNDLPEYSSFFDFEPLFKSVSWMLTNGIDSMLDLNAEQARVVCKGENEVDKEFLKLESEIINAMEKEPTSLRAYIHQLAVAFMMEQMGDELKKIAEDVIYMVEAKIVRHN